MSVLKKISHSMPIWGTIVGLASLVLLITLLLKGRDVALFNPRGLIAGEQLSLMIRSVSIMLVIAIPTLLFFFFTAWKYRESNEKAKHIPTPRHNGKVVFSIWAIPTVAMLILASIMWPATHRLAPQKSILNGSKAIHIQVIAMRWKWLFIYPEQQIATVNFIQIPTGTPLEFDLSADETPMSSFWIPHLGGQLYAMTGHVNRINLIADKPGDYRGSSAEINGSGFAGMKFIARAGSMQDFNQWVDDVKNSPEVLNADEYKKLLAPTEYNKTAFYSQAGPDIYDTMLAKYSGSHGEHTESK